MMYDKKKLVCAKYRLFNHPSQKYIDIFLCRLKEAIACTQNQPIMS